MRQLLPEPLDDIDVVAAYAGDARPAPPDRPWVMVNMIASADGATAHNGASGGVGGPADKAVFHAIRALPDVILVAAGTVRAEGYGPPCPSQACRELRRERGQAPAPRLAIVTASMDLDPASALFADAQPDARPILITAEDTSSARVEPFASLADVRRCGRGRVDLARALAGLVQDGLARLVLCEGGPSLNGALAEADLIDELCLSMSPLLVGGDSARIAHGPTDRLPVPLHLARLLEADGFLFARYLRRRIDC